MEDFNNLNPKEIPDMQKPFGVFGTMFSRMTSDMKFLGMFYIIYGVISSLTIIGAIIGIPLLISGLRLRSAADELNAFHSTNDSNLLRRGFELQGKFFNIHKIMVLVAIIIAVLNIVVIFFFLGSAISEFTN